MRNISKILGLLLLLPLFTGCNDSDDVAAIFTGKTWKLNYITVDGGHDMFPFWENEAQKTITTTGNFEGTWSANGKNNKFEATVEGNNGGDALAKNFLEGLNNATSYEGDENNLYLLYKPQSNTQTFRMVFRVVSGN